MIVHGPESALRPGRLGSQRGSPRARMLADEWKVSEYEQYPTVVASKHVPDARQRLGAERALVVAVLDELAWGIKWSEVVVLLADRTGQLEGPIVKSNRCRQVARAERGLSFHEPVPPIAANPRHPVAIPMPAGPAQPQLSGSSP